MRQTRRQIILLIMLPILTMTMRFTSAAAAAAAAAAVANVGRIHITTSRDRSYTTNIAQTRRRLQQQQQLSRARPPAAFLLAPSPSNHHPYHSSFPPLQYRGYTFTSFSSSPSSSHKPSSFSRQRPSRRRQQQPQAASASDNNEQDNNNHQSPILTSPFASEYHAPVMWREVLEYLITDPEGLYLDCTLGGGGHSEAILTKLTGKGQLISLDQDPDALAFAGKRLAKQTEEGRFRALRANFRVAADVLEAEGVLVEEGQEGGESKGPFAGMLLDLGVSSHQLDEASRGFSFRGDGPLDMRMQVGSPPKATTTPTITITPPFPSSSSSSLSAEDIVNKWELGALSKVLKEYGEEPRAYKLARAIVSARPLTSTSQLKEVIEKHTAYNDRPKTLARVFQGLRIAVNGEMDALNAILRQSTRLMKPGGRLVVLSYHSLEDRPVKRFMRAGNLEGHVVKDFYGHDLRTWRTLTRASLRPQEDEVEVNPRARSVSMRVAERTELTEQQVEEMADAPPSSAGPGPRGERGGMKEKKRRKKDE